MLLNCGLEKTLESPLDCREIKPVHPKGNQSWIFIGETNTEGEAPILWPPNVQSRLIRKDSHDGKNWRQEKKRTTEDEMVGWHHQLDGHESEQALGVGDGQGSGVLQLQSIGCDWATELTNEYDEWILMNIINTQGSDPNMEAIATVLVRYREGLN